MVGGTTPPQSDSGEISRVLVLNLLWQSKRCSRTAQDISVLTTPSLLSRVGYGDGRNWRAEAGAGLGRRRTVLLASSGAGADRHGSHRQLSLAGGFVERVGSRAVGGRCGADSCQLRAAAEDGQARCGAYSEAAGRGAVSEDLDAVERSARPAATAVASLQAGDHAGA